MSKEVLYTTNQTHATHQTGGKLSFWSKPKNFLILFATLSIESLVLSMLAPTLPAEILSLLHIAMTLLLLLMLVMYYRYFCSQYNLRNDLHMQIRLLDPAPQFEVQIDEQQNEVEPEKLAKDQATELDSAAKILQMRYRLTERETEIMILIGQGRSKRYISERLYISENTVRGHVKNIYIKCAVHNKQQLINQLESAA